MAVFTVEELQDALPAIRSTLSKTEKVKLKLKGGTSQHAATLRAIKAYNVAIELIKRELGASNTEKSLAHPSTKEELEQALEAMTSATARVEKIQPQLKPGTSQHTLAVRRIRAFSIATELINRELKSIP